MKINDLYDAVAGIDDDLIERADAARRGGNASAVRTASAHNTINTGRLTGIAASVIAAVCVMAVIISVAGPVAGGKGGHGYGFVKSQFLGKGKDPLGKQRKDFDDILERFLSECR